MKQAIIAVCCMVTIASSQWLERTFWLFDSFPELDRANVVFENPVTQRVYFSGWDCDPTHVYDQSAVMKFGYYDSVRRLSDWVHCPSQHLIWFCSRADNALVAYDDRVDTVVRVVGNVVDRPMVVSYVPGPEKLYVASAREPLVLTCDAVTGAVLDSITVPEPAGFLVADSQRNRLYVSGLDWDTCAARVVDCETDSVVAGIQGAVRITDMTLHPDMNRLYCLCTQDTVERNVIRVVDPDSLVVCDSVLIPLSGDWHDGGTLMPDFEHDLLWAGYINIWGDAADDPEDIVAIVNLAEDSLLDLVPLPPEFNSSSFAVNGTEAKLYLTSWGYDSLAVLTPDGTVECVPTSGEASGIGWSPTHNRVFLVGHDTVLVYDGIGDTLVGVIDYVGLRPEWSWWYPAESRLYVGNSEGVGWLDGNDTLVKWTSMSLDRTGSLLAIDEDGDRLYLEGASDTGNCIVVYDCSTDSVAACAPAPGRLGSALLLPWYAKMFVTYHYGDSVAVYDLDRDSVVATRDFNKCLVMMYSSRADRVYCCYRGRSEVVVVNPEYETVVGIIDILAVQDIAVSEQDNELWVLTQEDTLFVADCGTNLVVDTVLLPQMGPNVDIRWIPEHNKLYCLDDTVVHVVRCPTRAVSSISLEGFCRSGRGFLNARNDKLHLAGYDSQNSMSLRAVSSRWDSIVATIEAPVSAWAWNSVDNVMYGLHGKQVSVIKDDSAGIMSRYPPGRPTGYGRHSSIVRRSLDLTAGHDAVLVDIAGREVMVLRPGSNDVRHVSSGIYFVRGEEDNSTTRVVIQR